jgi:CHAT domain-containing protein/Tfp pilus assembly protein PilF
MSIAQERPDLEQFAARLESDSAPAALLKQLPVPEPELLSFCIARAKKKYDRFDFAGAVKGYRAAASLASAYADRNGVAKGLSGLGFAEWRSANLQPAVEVFQEGLEAGADDRQTLGDLYRGLGNAEDNLGRYPESLEHYGKARQIYLEVPNPHDALATFVNMSNIRGRQGDWQAKASMLRQALEESEKQGFQDIQAAALNNLGVLYFDQGDYERALEYDKRSTALVESRPHPDPGLLALPYGNLGVVSARLGHDSQALAYYEKAYEYAVRGNNPAVLNRVHLNRGFFYRVRGQPEKAAADLEPAIEFFEKSGQRLEAGVAMGDLAVALLAKGDLRAAAEWAERGVARCRDLQSAGAAPPLEAAGKVYLALGEREKARAAFQEAIDILETAQRRLAGGTDERSGFLHERIAPYHGMVHLAVADGKPLEALQYAERAKARLLLDVLQSGQARMDGSMSADEKQRERELTDALLKLDRDIAGHKGDPQRLNAWQQASAALESFRAGLYQRHPELRFHRGEFQPIGLDTLSELLPDRDTAVLEYTVTDYGIYLFAIARDANGKPQITVHTIPSGDIASAVRTFRRQIASRDLAYRATAGALYRKLVGAAATTLRGKRRWIVVPDAVLWDAPFQALISPTGRHAIEEAAIFYAPSLAVLREVARRRPTAGDAAHTLLAVGGPLAGPARELRELGDLYGTGSEVLLEGQATKERWKQEAGRYRILHVAAHGVLNANNALYSYLTLSSGTANVEEGYLTAREITELKLRADLTILSACETALGAFRFGEGVIGMNWAFLVAGSPATVVSQWKVDSAGSSALMLAFHRRIRAQGETISGRARALQAATLELIRSAQYRHPFYWAGFVMVGNGY